MTGTALARPRNSGLLGGLPLVAVLLALLAALIVSSLVAVGLGPVSIPPGEVVSVVGAHLAGGDAPGPSGFIVWELRVPRVLQGVAVGAGLAVAGLLTQAMVRNPLGEPFVLGLTSGAGAGAVLVLTGFGAGAAGLLTLPLAAFVGALAAALAVFAFSRTHGRIHPGRLVMTGIATGQLLAGVISFLLLRTQDVDAQQQILFWILGSLAGAQWPLALTCSAVVLALVLVSAAGAGRLNLLVLGDDGAASLGLDAARLRAVLLGVVALLTGTVVAVSGSIGFIGLIVPNLTRSLVGADHRRALPVAALLGALLIVWADTAARLVLAPTELPIGILTAAIGVPLFLMILRRGAAGTAVPS
ncbi:FecCD family ABC transporter permease [Streptomyces sp. JNUCC 64]